MEPNEQILQLLREIRDLQAAHLEAYRQELAVLQQQREAVAESNRKWEADMQKRHRRDMLWTTAIVVLCCLLLLALAAWGRR